MDHRKLDVELEKAIRKMDLGRGQNFSSLFEDFLDAALLPLCNNPNERQIDLWKRIQSDEKYAEAFSEEMTRYGDALKYDLENYTFFKIDRCFMPQGFWISTYWQYTLSNVAEINEKRNAWRLEMLKNGLWVELPRKTATEAPKEHVIEKEKETELPTTAKAVEGQCQLELF